MKWPAAPRAGSFTCTRQTWGAACSWIIWIKNSGGTETAVKTYKTTAYAIRVKKMDDDQRQPYAPKQACRACGNSRGELQFIVSGCPVVRCAQCRHVFLDIVHDAPSIEEMYRQYGCTDETVYFDGINAGVERNIDRFLARCRQYCAAAGPKPRLLDVGCGNGALLKRALQATKSARASRSARRWLLRPGSRPAAPCIPAFWRTRVYRRAVLMLSPCTM